MLGKKGVGQRDGKDASGQVLDRKHEGAPMRSMQAFAGGGACTWVAAAAGKSVQATGFQRGGPTFAHNLPLHPM
ncbi:hypothetical protein GCM10027195_03770 [Comamonas sediminis]